MNTNFNPQKYAIRMEINALKHQLRKTDYQAIKFAEGLISAEDYAPIRLQRQSWRDQINTLEAALNSNEE